MSRIAVVVQAARTARVTWKPARQSIEASDIGKNYEWIENPPGMRPKDFFIELLKHCATLDAEWIVRLEDDCLVNRHLIHNVTHWEALAEPDFGVGWLFVPKGHSRTADSAPTQHDRMHRNHKSLRAHRGVLHGSIGVVIRRTDIPWIIEAVTAWNKRNGDPAGFDISLSDAIDQRPGKTLYLHQPPLVEHQFGPSSLGHLEAERVSTGGKFSEDFRRLAPACAPTDSFQSPRRAFLLCAGSQMRWTLPHPKQLHVAQGERLLARAIRQVREMGYEPAVVTARADLSQEAKQRGALVLDPNMSECVTRTFLATHPLWSEETLVLVGDGYFQDGDLARLVAASATGPRCLGRADEIYGFAFGGRDNERMYRALQRVTWDALCNTARLPPPIQTRGKLFQLHRVLAGWEIDPPPGFLANGGWPTKSDVWLEAHRETRDYDTPPMPR
jgi:hypothetical protein